MEFTTAMMASFFVCTCDTIADATWNATHNGVKEFTVNASDHTEGVKRTCKLTGISPGYVSICEDEGMSLIYASVETDENDILYLENGIPSVKAEEKEYQLSENGFGIVCQRPNGGVTDEEWV